MFKKILIFFAFIISLYVFWNVAIALETNAIFEPLLNKTCLNDTHVFIYAEYTECNTTDCDVRSYNQTHHCFHGCDGSTGECEEPEYTDYLYILGFIFVIIIIIVWAMK